MAGLRVNQATMALVSSNVANAETPGYVRKSIDQVTTNTGSIGSGVNSLGINRELDAYIQAQLRTETSGASYATLKSNFLQQLQSIYGNPDSTGTLESAFNGLTAAVQALGTSPDSQSARIGVVNAAQVMAQQLNSMTQSIQALRGAAETGISDSVASANDLMKQIANINNHLSTNPAGGTSTDSATASLLDQRDQYIDQLSQLMDIRVTTNSNNQVTVFTNGGVQLVGNEAATLTFDAQGTVTPSTQWNSQESLSQLGSIRVSYSNGGAIDLTNTIKSGKIAAYVELRDNVLVTAQTQLDQLAATMASSLSDQTTAGTVYPASPATPTGFSLDTTGLLNGNSINISYTDVASGTQKSVTIVRVDNATVLPLPATTTANPNDTVVGINFSSATSVVAQLNAALGTSNLVFSGTAPNLIVEKNGPFSTVDSASITKTVTSLQGGSGEVPLFTDGGSAYSGSITLQGLQSTGFAGRITVNTGLVADPSKLVAYSSTALAGDTKRPNFITQQLTTSKYQYSASTGIGSAGAPFKGPLLSFMQQITSTQGATAAAAAQLAEGQNVVLNTLQQKMSAASGVNIDEEMAHLLSLQNAYSANARVMSTVNEMYKTLMQAF
jgi:flagellar hook-associated protein 1